MPNPIKAAVTSDAYTPACTAQDVYHANGGTFSVQGADALYELQYSLDELDQGSETWTDEGQVGPGTGHIDVGAIGIRFRSALPGTPATISAYINPPHRPGIIITSGGFGSATPNPAVTGVVELSDTLLVAPAATIPFTAIPALYNHLEITGSVYATAGSPIIGVQLNGDAGVNYFGRGLISGGGGQAGWSQAIGSPAGTISGEFGVMPLGRQYVFKLTIPGYKDAVAAGRSWFAVGGGLGNDLFVYNSHASGLWNNGAVISSVTLVLSASTFAPLSHATLTAY